MTILLGLLTSAFTIFGFWHLNRIRGMSKKERPKLAPNKLTCYLYMSLMLCLTVVCQDWRLIVDMTPSFMGFDIPKIQGYVPQGLVVFLSSFVGLVLSFSFGWGKYFPHNWNSSGGQPLYEEYEEPLGETVANLVVGKWDRKRESKFVINWKTWAMSGRFLWFTIVLFPLLAGALGNFWYLIIGALMPLAGLIYKDSFEPHTKESPKDAEYRTGALLGFLITLPIIIYYGL